jgi:hypothetical protein
MPRGRKPGTFKRLNPEEVSEQFRDSFLYDTQRLEGSSGRAYGKIDRICPACSTTVSSWLADVRQGLAKGTWTGLCHDCALRSRSRENHPSWVGGRREEKTGYIMLYLPDHPAAYQNGYILEHRLIMEKMIGRYLEPHETVHHKDGDRKNNHPDNLELWTKRRGNGTRVHDLSQGAYMNQYYTALIPLVVST